MNNHEIKPAPIFTLDDAEQVRMAIDGPEIMGKGTDQYLIRSDWIIGIINEIEATGAYPYNSTVQRECERRLGIEEQPESGSVLSILVYNAQCYRRSDAAEAVIERDGLEPFTQDLIDRAHAEGKRIEVRRGSTFDKCRTKDFGNGNPVRCMVPRARVRYYTPGSGSYHHYARIEK